MFMRLCFSRDMSLSRGKAKMLNPGENRTRDLGVTSAHALPSELHGQPDFRACGLVTNTQYHSEQIQSVWAS